MKKLLAILIGVMFIGCFIPAQAEVLSDSQLAGISAGQFDANTNDDVTATNSAVSSQKNIGVISSLNGDVSGSEVSNLNDATVTGRGDSAVALQANIAAVAGLGTATVSDGNKITNKNTATVTNEVFGAGSADLAFEGSSNSADAGINSLLSTVLAEQSAVVSQNNIAAIVGNGGVSNAVISNTNMATKVDNTGL